MPGSALNESLEPNPAAARSSGRCFGFLHESHPRHAFTQIVAAGAAARCAEDEARVFIPVLFYCEWRVSLRILVGRLDCRQHVRNVDLDHLDDIRHFRIGHFCGHRRFVGHAAWPGSPALPLGISANGHPHRGVVRDQRLSNRRARVDTIIRYRTVPERPRNARTASRIDGRRNPNPVVHLMPDKRSQTNRTARRSSGTDADETR